MRYPLPPARTGQPGERPHPWAGGWLTIGSRFASSPSPWPSWPAGGWWQAGVGALYLGRIGTPFALGDAGRLRSSGLYLTEAGTARALQQIDLAV